MSFDRKSASEIEIVKELLKYIKKGIFTTMDLAHCNRKTIEMVHKKYYYLAQFKGNQKALKKEALELEKKEEIISEHWSVEYNRGQVERRRTKVYKHTNSEWAGAKSIVIQERWRNSAYTKAFYLSNTIKSAEEFCRNNKETLVCRINVLGKRCTDG